MALSNETSICLFGSSPIRLGGKPFHLGISGATEKLFQYLLVNLGAETRREFLAELIWRGTSMARQRSALNSAIWRIKRQLRELEGIELTCTGRTVSLRIAPTVRIDARDLSDIVHSISLVEPLDEGRAESLYRALNACNAPFMDGVSADWVLAERERLFNVQIRGMIILMHWLGQQRRYEDALEIGRRLLTADPAREAAQCEVMLLYVLNGQRAQALRQYQEFRGWLKRELDIEPMPETRVLHEYIRKGLNNGGTRGLDRAADTRDGETRRSSFGMLLRAIDRSRRELYEVLCSELP